MGATIALLALPPLPPLPEASATSRASPGAVPLNSGQGAMACPLQERPGVAGGGWQFGFPDKDRAMVLAMDLFAKSLNSLSLDLLSSSIK